MSTAQRQKFKDAQEVDLAYSVAGLGRFRCNVFQQRGTIGIVLRVIPVKVMNLDELGLPPVLSKIAHEERGLVLVTGTTGSGKSTSLAAMIDHINANRTAHVITIEDPIEYLHRDIKCIINQREIGVDTRSFAYALRSALRQDPDVILVGEMRDNETIHHAITAAETGHLVFGTLHTNSAAESVDRMVGVFPSEQQEQIRTQLSNSLVAIVSQQLLPSVQGGRVAAIEIMVVNSAIRNLIRENKAHQMTSIIQTQTQIGMQTMDQALKELFMAGRITYEDALSRANNPAELEVMISGGDMATPAR
jgi:twitching motility protein PilT